MINRKQVLLAQQVLFSKLILNFFHFSIFYSTDFRCKYCFKDFERAHTLSNHIYKTNCGTYHPPNTSANVWAEKRKYPCTQPGCNGSYSSKSSLETHLSHRHGIHKSTRKLKVEGRQVKGNVCNFKPNRRKKSNSKNKKGQKRVNHIQSSQFLHQTNQVTFKYPFITIITLLTSSDQCSSIYFQFYISLAQTSTNSNAKKSTTSKQASKTHQTKKSGKSEIYLHNIHHNINLTLLL